jgi:hypothetical protein
MGGIIAAAAVGAMRGEVARAFDRGDTLVPRVCVSSFFFLYKLLRSFGFLRNSFFARIPLEYFCYPFANSWSAASTSASSTSVTPPSAGLAGIGKSGESVLCVEFLVKNSLFNRLG